MTSSFQWDAVVVGGGPAGATAATLLSRHGLRCLVLEKASLSSRNKVCSGMLMSRMAQDTISRVFGEIPQEILAPPRALAGYMVHFPGAEPQTVAWHTPIGWRKDIDQWMDRKAVEAGAALREESRVASVASRDGGYAIRFEGRNGPEEVTARFLVGADGARSVVRRDLFGDDQVRYVENLRECYQGAGLRLEAGYFHAVFLPQGGLLYSAAHEKDGCLLLEMGAMPGKVREHQERVKAYLAERYGFDSRAVPKWRDACLEPLLLRPLVSRSFVPAKANVLLTGDAAGLLTPLTGEGIGGAVKSGEMAAQAIISVATGGSFASDLYLASMGGTILSFDRIYARVKEIGRESGQGARYVAEKLRECWEATLRVA